MAKMTKTQSKRAYLAIKQKAQKLWSSSISGGFQARSYPSMSTQDLVAIEKICDKYLKKF